MSESDISSKRYKVRVITERCKECGFCIEFCRQEALIKSTEINSHGYHLVSQDDNDKCTGCNICAMICPEFAINVTPIKEEVKHRR
ncbi:ATP-binding protein [Chloroflexota bacterium]